MPNPRPPTLYIRARSAGPNNELFGAVRINLVGREPRGRVARGQEYDELLGWLSERLLELEDADTGRPLVRRLLAKP